MFPFLTINDYQDRARKTAIGHNLDHFVHGLTEEAGEVAGIMKRFHRGDSEYYSTERDDREYRNVLSPMAKDKLVSELGDVLWYVAMIADLLEVRLEEVANRNLAKLADRKNRNVITGSGDNR